MVGEIRDLETAQMAIQAALTGADLGTEAPSPTWDGLRVPVGCPACRGTGFRGRLAVCDLTATAETARLAGTLATLLDAGVPLLDALRTAAPTLANGRYRAAMADVVAEVARGGALADALGRTGRFGPLAVRMTAIGERTGRLPAMLARLATIEATAHGRRLDGLLALLAPMLTIVIGLVVGGVILSVMAAIGGLNDLAFR
jgi:general secretion pathway protein F